MKSIKLLALACAVALSACSSLPLPVNDTPTLAPVISADGKTFTPVVISAEDLLFGPIDTFDQVKAIFKGYYLTYTKEAQNKRVKAQNASEVGFYGAILGVAGGMVKDVGTAIAGGVIGSGAGLYGDRYKLQTQAQSYEVSADAMLCMYLASQDISSASASALVLPGSVHTADIDARDIAIDGMLKVRAKLYKLQSTFQLGTPDPGKLKDALTAGKAGTPEAKSALVALSTEEALAQAKAQAQLTVYKNQIDACVAKTAG